VSHTNRRGDVPACPSSDRQRSGSHAIDVKIGARDDRSSSRVARQQRCAVGSRSILARRTSTVAAFPLAACPPSSTTVAVFPRGTDISNHSVTVSIATSSVEPPPPLPSRITDRTSASMCPFTATLGQVQNCDARRHYSVIFQRPLGDMDSSTGGIPVDAPTCTSSRWRRRPASPPRELRAFSSPGRDRSMGARECPPRLHQLSPATPSGILTTSKVVDPVDRAGRGAEKKNGLRS